MALSTTEKIRLLIGLSTTSPFTALIADEELEWLYEYNNQDLLLTAKQAAFTLSLQLAQVNTKEKFGDVEAWNEVSKQYLKALQAFIADVKTTLILPKGCLPYAAGISTEDLIASMNDSDNPNLKNWLYMAGVADKYLVNEVKMTLEGGYYAPTQYPLPTA